MIRLISRFVDDNNHQINIPFDVFKEKIGDKKLNLFLKKIHEMINNHQIDFPLKKYYNLPYQQLFENLKNINHGSYLQHFDVSIYYKFISFLLDDNVSKEESFGIESKNDDYDNIDVICDIFQEKERIKAKRHDQEKSPLQIWYDHNNELIINCIKEQKDINTFNLRENLYQICKECTQFKPTIAYIIYQMTNANRILDISAGWGDRMIGAIAHNPNDYYIGIDPNFHLKEGHDQIIELLSDNNNSKYKIIYEPFETCNLSNYSFDLIFSSPPFFNLEEYTDNEGQSIINYPNYNNWVKEFLFKSLLKAWNHLETNGYLMIHMNDFNKYKICVPMVLFMYLNAPGSSFKGVIGTKGKSQRIFPIWCWQKTDIEQKTKEKTKQCNDIINRFYKNLFYK